MDRALATRRPKLVIHVPVEPIVSHLIGNLVDGGSWRLTSHCPEPVAPWTGPVGERARVAHQQLIEGLQALEALVREAESLAQLGRYPCNLRGSLC